MQDGMHIDIGQELQRLKKTLNEAQRKIMFRAEVATVKNCRKLVRTYVHVSHVSLFFSFFHLPYYLTTLSLNT